MTDKRKSPAPVAAGSKGKKMYSKRSISRMIKERNIFLKASFASALINSIVWAIAANETRSLVPGLLAFACLTYAALFVYANRRVDW